MRVVTQSVGDTLYIDRDIEITVVAVTPSRVILAVSAPQACKTLDDVEQSVEISTASDSTAKPNKKRVAGQ